MRLGIIGYGNVGSAVARAALAAGHQVTLATNPANPAGAAAARDAHPGLAAARIGAPLDVVADADLVVLAVPFATVEQVVAPLREALAGRILVDATNPVGPGLTHGLGSHEAGAQRVAAAAPQARVVKAFSVYGFENLTEPPTGPTGMRAIMPIAGDDPAAKATVAELLTDLGWQPLDTGPLAAALHLEHLTLLWVRLVRVLGHDPRLVWAALPHA